MGKNQYHHGDLRTALLDAAEAALNDDPSRDLSIRALAGELGVSATAPHAHFKTKTDLLVALAIRGFEKLRASTIESGAKATNDVELMTALAQAYILFGRSHPGLYRIMFTTGVSPDQHPDLFIASRTSYAILQEAIERIYPDLGETERNRRSLGAWSLVHGLTALQSERRIPTDIVDDNSPEALAKIAAETVLRNESR